MFRSIRRAGNLLLLHLVAKYLRCALFTFYLVSQMVFVRVVRFVSAKGLDVGCVCGRGDRGVQWGICHVAMFGSLPANKYYVLCWSIAGVGREEVPHLASASGNAINPVGRLWHLLQVAFAPNSYLVTTRISRSLPNSPSLSLYR